MLLYLIRHGETVWNREHRFQGRLDMPLNETGLRQARQLAGRMAGVTGVTRLWCSPLQRASVTADQIAAAMGLTSEPLPGLEEIDMGLWAGRPVPELLSGPEGGALRHWLSEDPDAALEEVEAEEMPDWFKKQIGSVFGKM